MENMSQPANWQPSWIWKGRIPCLDGLRAVAIAIVLFEHVHNTRGFDYPILRHIADRIAGLGPDIFFVISGFLITLLLIREQKRTDSVSLPSFFVRRGLRLAPAFVTFLLIVYLLNYFKFAHISSSDWTHALTYTVNFELRPSWEIGHLWSFSIEEQFYLLWPLTFLFLGVRRARIGVALWLVFAPLIRLAVYSTHPQTMGQFDTWTPFRVDPIAIGSLLALCSVSPKFCNAIRVQRSTAFALIAACTLIIVLSLWARPIVSIYDVSISLTVESLCIAAIVWLAANHSDGLLGRTLTSRSMVGLGTLAYSLFLWQQLFLNPRHHESIYSWPLNILAAIACAIVSYVVIERPFLQLKEGLKKNQSAPPAMSGVG